MPNQDLDVARIFEEHVRYVWRSLLHLGVREADAEDVCQEVFVVVQRKLGEFEGRSSVRTWLYGIAVLAARDYRRRAHVRREEPRAEVELGSVEAAQHARLEQQQELGSLARALSELDEDQRSVFVLYEIEDVPMKEIASLLACPLPTAYSRLHAARRHVLARAGAQKGQGGER
jgi:RNA polymerase sigma-70 factor (ECF subfamily)